MLERLSEIRKVPLYARIISYFVHLSDVDDNLRAFYIIGSRAQKKAYATQYSDLDVEIVVKDRFSFEHNRDWISNIQDSEFSYIQKPSDGIGNEVRVVFSENTQLVDFTFLTREEFTTCYSNEQFRNGVFGRGVVFLVDKDRLLENIECKQRNVIPPLTEETLNTEYCNILFHLLYAQNKIKAGEFITAMNTINVSIRNSLMKIIRWREHLIDPEKDLWHRARHFEQWALPEHQKIIKETAPPCNSIALLQSLIKINMQVRPLIKDLFERTGFNWKYTKNIGTQLVFLPRDLKGHQHV